MKWVCFFSGFLLCLNIAPAQIVQSHNDYRRDEPFTEAFEAGAGIIEADLWMKDGRIVVCHGKSGISRAPDFEVLYVRRIVAQGDMAAGLYLMCELKAPEVMGPLVELLGRYPAVFRKGMVEVIVSGKRPHESEFSKYPPYILFDGRFGEDYSREQQERIYMVSEPVTKFARRNGKPRAIRGRKAALNEMIAEVHSRRMRVRFWGARDNEKTWSRLMELGVDVINTDKPGKCVAFVRLQHKEI